MVQLRTLESTPYYPKSIKTFGSPAELPIPIQDTPQQVIVDNNGSPAEEQGAYRYCHCVRSAFHLSNTPWNNRTTIAQVPRFNLSNTLSKSTRALSAQALPHPKSCADQNALQPKASVDQNVPPTPQRYF
jgi:hypothetical protein